MNTYVTKYEYKSRGIKYIYQIELGASKEFLKFVFELNREKNMSCGIISMINCLFSFSVPLCQGRELAVSSYQAALWQEKVPHRVPGWKFCEPGGQKCAGPHWYYKTWRFFFPGG